LTTVGRDRSTLRRRAGPVITVLVALVTFVALTEVDTYTSQSCASDRFNQPVCVDGDSRTLPEENGSGVLVLLAIPAVVALVGVTRPTRNVLLGVAALLSVLLLPAMMTVGVFYVPTALVAWLVFVDADRRERAAGRLVSG
jgi:hypothetical protein